MSAPRRPLRLRATLRVVADTMAYRLRNGEAGNLVTSATLAAALRLAPGDIAYRIAFGLGLNAWVYLVNDCFDVEVDLHAPGRDTARTRFLADNLDAGWAASVGLGVALLASGAAHSVGLLLAFVTTAAVILGYSRWFKHRPVLDLVAMFAWGVSMALVGFPLDHAAGWRLAGLLGILCAVTEALQVLRDEPSDRAAGVRTTAVALGAAATARLARGLMLLAAAYTALLIHRWLALGLLVAPLVPLRRGDEARAWNRLKLLFGLVWLALLGALWWSQRLDGLWRG